MTQGSLGSCRKVAASHTSRRPRPAPPCRPICLRQTIGIPRVQEHHQGPLVTCWTWTLYQPLDFLCGFDYRHRTPIETVVKATLNKTHDHIPSKFWWTQAKAFMPTPNPYHPSLCCHNRPIARVCCGHPRHLTFPSSQNGAHQ